MARRLWPIDARWHANKCACGLLMGTVCRALYTFDQPARQARDKASWPRSAGRTYSRPARSSSKSDLLGAQSTLNSTARSSNSVGASGKYLFARSHEVNFVRHLRYRW